MALVRPYRGTDYTPVARLFRQLSRTHHDLYHPKTARRSAPDRWFQNHLRKYGRKSLRVAEANGRVVGVVGVLPHRSGAEIEPLVVAARHRRQGIGRLLVQAVTVEAERKRWKFLTVGITPRNGIALRTFHALGFRTLVSVELERSFRQPRLYTTRPGLRIAGRRFRS